MIKSDIVKAIAVKLDLKDKEALAVVDGILESMKDVICEYRRLEIRDFGVFQIKSRKERVGRNPRDKTEYPIPPRHVVTFKVGKEMKVNPELLEAAEGSQRSGMLAASEGAPASPEE